MTGFGPDNEQLLWLQDDLERANKNRDKQPFIVVFGHRPWSLMDGSRAVMEGSCYSTWPNVKVMISQQSSE